MKSIRNKMNGIWMWSSRQNLGWALALTLLSSQESLHAFDEFVAVTVGVDPNLLQLLVAHIGQDIQRNLHGNRTISQSKTWAETEHPKHSKSEWLSKKMHPIIISLEPRDSDSAENSKSQTATNNVTFGMKNINKFQKNLRFILVLWLNVLAGHHF